MDESEEARKRLRAWCDEEHGRIQSLADEHGVDRSTCHRWLAGSGRPSPPSRVLIERRCGIPKEMWGDA